MHELSIAQALVEQVERVRLENGGGRVLAVGVRVGEWRLVVPEVLTSYYKFLAAGTPLEGSRVEIETVPATAWCKQCECVFNVEQGLLVCERCGSPGGELLSGKELDLVRVELED
ncbi:MAG: hydrogenase maturation nickel metallochaperone HypA [Thermoleophilia bacterium]|nr:hydrogenase maturation nickel metallochaperone HypA [Thermoleophilia bacterium]